MLRPMLFPLLATLILVNPAVAATIAYALDRDNSTVAFETDFGPDIITGTIPLNSADLTLDFEQVKNCTISVDLDVSGAQASFPFAAQALKGPKVLDAKNHPRMVFESTAVKAAGDGAAVTGNLTIRGVTRPVTLRAEIYRQKGSEAGDLSRLTVRLTGKVKRSEFGATGWSDMVSDEVRIVITARIEAQG
jgi:polyisoprenoid-binding protein YceI